jgi:hypothetical protein
VEDRLLLRIQRHDRAHRALRADARVQAGDELALMEPQRAP